jgi:hypothetical protein
MRYDHGKLMEWLIPGIGHIRYLTHSIKGRSSRTKTPAAAPARATSMTGTRRTRLPAAMIGTPVTIQAVAKNGKLQMRDSKVIWRFQERRPKETAHAMYVAAKAISEI